MSFVNQEIVSSILKPGTPVIGYEIPNNEVPDVLVAGICAYFFVSELVEETFDIIKNFLKR